MQEYNYYNEPSPHIIIDNFLEPRLAAKCLAECIRIEPFYEPAITMGDDFHAQHEKECVDCKENIDNSRLTLRDNDVVYLDSLYSNGNSKSIIMKSIHTAITSIPFIDYFKTLPGLFPIIVHTETTQNVLSRYGRCDFYGWHTDIIPDRPAARVITLCYYMNEEPEQFEGGDLIVTGKTVHDTLKIKPKHNRAVIFESGKCVHAVDTVKLDKEEFKNGRFSLNCWIGFGGDTKYR